MIQSRTYLILESRGGSAREAETGEVDRGGGGMVFFVRVSEVERNSV